MHDAQESRDQRVRGGSQKPSRLALPGSLSCLICFLVPLLFSVAYFKTVATGTRHKPAEKFASICTPVIRHDITTSLRTDRSLDQGISPEFSRKITCPRRENYLGSSVRATGAATSTFSWLTSNWLWAIIRTSFPTFSRIVHVDYSIYLKYFSPQR